MTASPTASPSSSPPSPTATAVAYLDPEGLPPASLEDEGATTICDPEASQFDGNAGPTVVPCYDGTLLGLRALHTAMAKVDRIYLRRTPCQQIPCTTSELSVVTVIGWTGNDALSVVLDNEHNTVTVPQSDPLAVWPMPGSTVSPEAKRVDLKGAPKVVCEREPYPYCGDAPDGQSPIRSCFRYAVLDGRQVEMIDHNIVTGDVWVMRFDGQGLIWRYGEGEGGGWFRDGGSLILGIDATRWSYDNWRAAEPIS
jgi:hypothetical protein